MAKIFNEKALLVCGVLLITLGFVFMGSPTGSYAASVNIPSITGFKASEEEDNALILTLDTNNTGYDYSIEAINDVLKQTNNFVGTKLAYQNLIADQSYRVQIRACTNSATEYSCSNWSDEAEATAQVVPDPGEECGEDASWDSEEKKCVPDEEDPNENCEDEDSYWDDEEKKCVKDDDSDNPCEEGQIYDETSKSCVDDPKYCEDGTYNEDKKACVDEYGCLATETYDEETNSCVSDGECEEGKVYSSESDSCIDKPVCGEGEEYNDETEECEKSVECAEGKFWNEDTEECETENLPLGDIGKVKLSKTKYVYKKGTKRTPTATVTAKDGTKLKKKTDYTLTYKSGRTNIGKYSVTAKGTGSYSGSATAYFTIIPANTTIKSVTKNKTSLKVTANTKDGGVSYQYAYRKAGTKDYKKVGGSATKTISGLSTGTKYNVKVRTYKKVGSSTYYSSAWSKTKSYVTKGVSHISSIALSTTKYTYNGSYKKPSVKVTGSLDSTVNSKNYTVTYPNSNKGGLNVGSYKVTVKGKGDYTGTKTATFTINPPNGSISSIVADKTSLTVKLSAPSKNPGVNYQVEYKKSVDPESAYVKVNSSSKSVKISNLTAGTSYNIRLRTYKTVSGTTYYSGWSAVKTKATAGASTISIAGGTATLSYETTTYSGSEKKPTATVVVSGVTLKSSTDYTLSYSSNKNVGTASVMIVGKGNYTGSITKKFKINPKGTSISSRTITKSSITPTVKSVSGVTGYQYSYKLSTASSYTTKSSTKTSYKISGLSKSKKYNVRVRTYQKVSGTTYYSGWSAVKTYTTSAK